MNTKKAIIWGVGALFLLLAVWFGMTVGGVASEASNTDSMLKNALAQKLGQSEVSQELTAKGFTMKDGPGESDGEGPVHSALFYTMRLSVKLNFDGDNKLSGYHVDRS